MVELDWWQTHPLVGPKGTVDILLSPAQHWSTRNLGDRMATLWGGFAVFASDCHLFYAGDTGYSRDFVDLREHIADRQGPDAGGGFDIALLPIGAYEPRWFMRDQHVNPAEAVKIHRDIGAKRSLGVHWGTFELTDEALDEPPRSLAVEARSAGLTAEEFFVLGGGRDATARAPVAAGASAPVGVLADCQADARTLALTWFRTLFDRLPRGRCAADSTSGRRGRIQSCRLCAASDRLRSRRRTR